MKVTVNPKWVMKVKSSNIRKVIYYPKRKKLKVFFHNGSIYLYSDVLMVDLIGFSYAESKGKWFHKNVRGKKKFEEIK